MESSVISKGIPNSPRTLHLDREELVQYPGDAGTLEDILHDIARNHLNISPVSIQLFAFKQVEIRYFRVLNS